MDDRPRRRKLRLPPTQKFRNVLQELQRRTTRARPLFSHKFTQQEVERPDELLYHILQQFKDMPFTARITVGENVIKEHNFNFQGQRVGKAYETFRLFFFEDNSSDREFLPDTNMKIKIYPLRRQEPIPVFQRFRDGDTHCVFTPLIKLWEQPAKSKSTQKEHDQILKRIKKLAEKYGNNPVPQTEMEDVAKQSNTTIRIYDPLGNPYLTYNKSARKTLHLTLTRNNHVEPSAEDKETREVTHEEGINYLKTKDDWTLIGTLTDPIIIYTPTERLEIINPMKPYIQEIKDQIPYSTKLDAKKYPIINDFILEARIINSATLTFQEQYDAHYDLEKAYTQFHTTPYYNGFLGIIHQWRSFTDTPISFMDTHIGIYKCKVIKSIPLATMLGLKENEEYVLPSPEWKFFQDNGIELQLISGLWGSSFNFTFPESSKLSIPTRTGELNKPFRIFSGQCSNVTNKYDKDTYTIPSTEEYASHLATLYPDTFYNEELKIAQVHIPKDVVRTNHHILAFITSYTRIVMMTEMLKFNIEDISAVTLDGLYFKGLPPNNLIPQFRPKPAKHDPYGESYWYTPTHIQENFPPLTIHNESQFFSGAGGTGKTHTILSNTGFNDPLYVSPTNELGRDKRETYKVNATTLHVLIGRHADGSKIRSYEERFGTPPVIFIDEITQSKAEYVEEAIKLYPNSLIFVAGDVDETGRHFQCKYENKIWKPTLPTIHFTTDYRSQSTTLKQIKEELRNFMKEDPTPHQVKLYAKAHFHHIPLEEAIKQFNPNQDIHIAGTHKYIKTIPHKVYTTHKYQGRTVEQPSKLFISTFDLFEHTMLYTALSRARHHEQLVFVD